jgi:hypothetical protein
MFDLVVAAPAQVPTGGGSSGVSVYPIGHPNYVPPSGSSASSGKPQGYRDPVTGIVYSDPAGTQPCPSCGNADGTPTNTDPPKADPPSTDSDSPGGGGSGGQG